MSKSKPWAWLPERASELPLVGGGDSTAGTGTLAELIERRTRILRDLDDPNYTGDLTALVAEADQVRAAIEEWNGRVAAAQQARTALLGTNPPADDGTGTPPGGQRIEVRGADSPEVRATIGQLFTRSDQLNAFRERNYSGQVAIEFPGHVRALIDTSGTSGGAFQNPQRPTDVPQANRDRPLRVADLIDRRQTGISTVEWIREDTAANAGGTAAEVAEGAAKPEATFTFTVVTDSVRTIAHWVNITRQAAEDDQQLQGYIEGRLAYGVENRLDAQIINGNGTAPNLRGILQTSGIGTYVAAASEAAIISVRKGITVAQLSEYQPDTVVLNPTDWQRIELSTDSQGMFRVSPNVANALAPRVWGLNVVVTTAIAAATALVGAMREGATLWERDGVRVLMTDSHASNFTANILTLLAEMRAALSVWRPKAFVKVTLDAAGN